MNNTELFIFIIELIGTFAFASSGALLGIRKKMDIFGVNVLAVITAVGGGLIRDIMIGTIPPVMFQKPIYTLTAIIAANILFVLIYIHPDLINQKFMATYEKIMMICDAIGLGIFSVTGVIAGLNAGQSKNHFFIISLGVLTGVGGGVFRDILSNELPYILVRHIYACASIMGALFCAYAYPIIGRIPAMMVGAGIVICIRLLAMHFRWNLPKIKYE